MTITVRITTLKTFLTIFLTTAVFFLPGATAPIYAQGTWTDVFDAGDHENHANVSFNSVAYGNGNFVAVGYSSDLGAGMIFTSPDGKAWTRTYDDDDLDIGYCVRYLNGQFVAIGDWDTYHNTIFLLSSPTGTDWIRHDSATNLEVMSNISALKAITYGNGLYLIANAGYIYSSPDLYQWTEATVPRDISYIWEDMAYHNGKFMAVGWDIPSSWAVYHMITSTDGLTWTEANGAPKADGSDRVVTPGYSIKYLNGRFVAGGDANQVISSTDGANWTDRTIRSANSNTWSVNVEDIDYANERYVIAADNRIRTSSDLQAYAYTRTVDIEHMYGVAHSDEAFVVVGDDGAIYYSPFSSREAEPIITSAAAAVATEGESFSYRITTNFAADWFGVDTLDGSCCYGYPDGLGYDANTGIISGKPSETGTFTFLVGAKQSASDAGNVGAQKILTITVSNQGTSPSTTTTIPDTSTTTSTIVSGDTTDSGHGTTEHVFVDSADNYSGSTEGAWDSASITAYFDPECTSWIAWSDSSALTAYSGTDYPGKSGQYFITGRTDDYISLTVTNPGGESLTAVLDDNSAYGNPTGPQNVIFGTSSDTPDVYDKSPYYGSPPDTEYFLDESGAFSSVFTEAGYYIFNFEFFDRYGQAASHGDIYLLSAGAAGNSCDDGSSSSSSSSSSSTTTTTTGQDGDLFRITDYTLTSEAGLDKQSCVTAPNNNSSFTPGEHVCLWLSYQNAPAGTYLDLKWYNNNVLIFEDQQELSDSSCYWTCRTIKSPGSWKVEGFRGGVLQLAANFTVSGNRADCPLEKLPGGNNLEIDTVRRFRDQVLMR
ncbi:MAG: hypothetical protein GY868_01735, partial [Deltaproteobacteria bacterium]|nr:hypothetical protein [Deltaproteobacteria bacterium]